ncbi:MAG: hypothetical protein KAS88_00375 [Deltaproteobacteria bacterium]|nr:hypothetical protein [Deltaproteobacteria bacterium]
MSDIVRSMERKGFKALAVNDRGGIGFKASFKEDLEELEEPVWFDTGLKMKGIDKNGLTVEVNRSVCARDKQKYREYEANGWKPTGVGNG